MSSAKKNNYPHPPPVGIARPGGPSSLHAARVYSHHGVVIDADNRVRADLSPDLLPPPAGHRLMNYSGLPESTHLPHDAFLLPAPSAPKNYYHWLIESLPKLRHLPGDLPVLAPLSQPFHAEALRAAGIPKANWFPLHETSHLAIPKLHARPPVKPTSADLRYLQRLFAPGSVNHTRRRLYISRHDTWRRRILNENALYSTLEKHGFEFHTMANLDIRTQAALFAQASHIIAPHGAALTNLIFCPPETRVLELFADNYHRPHYKNLAACHQISYQAHFSQTDHEWPDFELDLSSFQNSLRAFLAG